MSETPIVIDRGGREYRLIRSDLADFLYFATYHMNRFNYFPKSLMDDWSSIPETQWATHFPPYAIHHGARTPDEALELLEPYSREEISRWDNPLVVLKPLLESALHLWPAFREAIAPQMPELELRLLDTWHTELSHAEYDPIHELEKITGVGWNDNYIELGVSAYHTSASCFGSKPIIWGCMWNPKSEDPKLAHQIGHEGWHYLLHQDVGSKSEVRSIWEGIGPFEVQN